MTDIHQPGRRGSGWIVKCGATLGKVLLSGLAAGLLLAVVLAAKIGALHRPAAPVQPRAAPSAEATAKPAGKRHARGVYWPAFPGRSAIVGKELVLNGVPFISEEWDTIARPADTTDAL